MNFLYPGFLFSLLAIAIPILIHLFNFRKFKKVYFSNVRFLKAAKEQNSSREELKNLFVLACRILAIIFLVLAFARPYWSSETGIRSENGNLINIYLDNSYSMESVNKDGSLLDEAKRRAKAIAKGFLPNDKFQLSTNDFEGRHQRLVSYEELLNLIDEVKISSVHRTLQQVINRQQAVNAGSRNIFSYVLSDFQTQFTGRKKITSAPDNHLSLVRLNANAIPNISADSIWSLSPAHKPGDQERFVVRLRNYSAEDGKDIPLKLSVNNQQRAVARINIPAGKSVTDTLSFGGLSAGWQKAVLNIKDFPVTFDDELKFSFKVNSGMQILHINGDPAEKHINALFAGDSYFKLTVMPESAINYSTFSTYNLIMVSGLKEPSSGLAQELKGYLKNGGSVVLFPDLDNKPADFSAFLRELSLPGISGLRQDTTSVSNIDLKSNVFNDVFEEIPSKLDLPKVNRYFAYTKNSNSNQQDILSFPNGLPFFICYRNGEGQLYLSATSLQAQDSNLPQHPIFVPLIYKIAFNSVQDLPLYYTVGKDNLLSAPQIYSDPNASLRLIAGKQEVIPEVRQVPGKTQLYVADQIRKSGFYELYQSGVQQYSYAFNENRAESDMHYTDDKTLEQLFDDKKIAVNTTKGDLPLNAVKNNHSDLWKLCLVLCAVFLAAEALFIRFFNHKNI